MSKLINFKSIKKTDIEKLGLRCGIEIHQQLNCGKLFCSCPCEIIDNNEFNKKIQRKLRFSLSETGEIDKAAADEFKKNKSNFYKFNNNISCLVDLDEEPPQKVNQKAFNLGISIGKIFNITFFDEVQFMRKLIINGSIISGFQRTALIGQFGKIKTPHGVVGIEGINIEEDSARTLERQDGHTIFALDRQGIPLIEITTAPDIKTPLGAQEVALEIGNILRSFKETRRGLGTIRQDLNVSITGGNRVEIKGTQNLKLIPEIVENEMIRQKVHHSILEELKNRKIDKFNFSDRKIIDISEIFSKTESKIVKNNLKDDYCKVLAIKLNKFEGILKCEMQENFRFATEISNRNKEHYPQIKGLFHSDELPAYSISKDEVNKIYSKLNCEKRDSFILLAGEEKLIRKSLDFILEIVSELITKQESQVRMVDPKGVVTKFIRPMPGSARMYPETDIGKIPLDEDFFKNNDIKIPELYNNKLERLTKNLLIEKRDLVEFLETFEENQIKSLIDISDKSAKQLFNILFTLPKDIRKRENLEPINFKFSLLEQIFSKENSDTLTLKTIRDLFISLYKDKVDEVENLKEYLDKKGLNLEKVDEKQVEKKIKEIISKNPNAPFGALMGIVMKEFKGRVEGKLISRLIKKYSD